MANTGAGAETGFDGTGLIPVSRFTTDGVDDAKRVEFWRGHAGVGVGRVFETRQLEPLSVSSATMILGPITLSYSHYTSQDWVRPPALIRADAVDLLAVNIRFSGDGEGDANGRSFSAGSGSILLIDLARPQAHFSQSSFTASFTLPRPIAERLLGPMEQLHGLVVPPDRSVLLVSYLREMERMVPTLPLAQATRMGQVALDLLAVSVAGMGICAAPLPDRRPTAARMRVEAAIDSNLRSPELTVANLCRWTGMSRSALYQLFEADGGAMAFIRDRRLERIAQELRAGPAVRIGTLAARWNLDSAYLSRAFKVAYGMSPRAYRDHRVDAGTGPTSPAALRPLPAR